MSLSYKGREVAVLDPDQPLRPGDRILIRFGWLLQGNYSRATQWLAIESYLENRPDFEVVSYINENEWIDVEILIKAERMVSPYPPEEQEPWRWPTTPDPSEPIRTMVGPVTTAAVIAVTAKAIATVVVSVTVYLAIRSCFRFIEKVVVEGPQTPQAQAVVKSLGVMAYATIFLVGYLFLRGIGLIKR